MAEMHALDPYVENDILYPSSDGERMADNMLEDFVAGDLLWYPVRGDVFVALMRTKGSRLRDHLPGEHDERAPPMDPVL